MSKAPLFVLLAALLSTTARGCPVDSAPRAVGTLLTVTLPRQAPVAFGETELAAAGSARLTQRRTVSSANGRNVEQSLVYEGTLLRDVLARAGLAEAADRSLRNSVVEAVATDGYRAHFSWGELYNSAAGEQLLVIHSQDGKPLDSFAGPLALRALADLRPGPRHVRNLCALVLRPL